MQSAFDPFFPRGLQAYGDNIGRLSSIKGKYDPTNLFNQNMNIPPAATG